jgi:hypothetical protein
VLNGNVGRNGKAKAGTVLPGREKWIEDVIPILWSDASPSIGYFHAKLVISGEGADGDHAFPLGCLDRIQDQV